MKVSPIALFILLNVALNPAASAQLETNAAPSSGLQLNNRTDAERIEFLLSVAEVYFSEEDFESALTAYERILEIDPKNEQSRYIIAHVYISAKEYGEAEKLLLELIDVNPDDFKLKNNLAWLYATAENPKYRNGKKAVRYAQEAMAISPNDHHIWSTLSEAHYINGEFEKAFKAITNMAKLASRYGKGLTEEQVGDYNEQIRKCKRAWDTQKMLEGDDEE